MAARPSNVRYSPKSGHRLSALRCPLSAKSGRGAVPAIVEIGPVGGLRHGPPVREAWTNRGRVLRRLGEPNLGRDYGSHQLAAVPQSVLHGGSPKSRDLLRVFRTAYRSDTHVQQATFGTLRIPSASPVVRSNDASSLVPRPQSSNWIAIIILPSQGRGRACGSSS